MGLASVRLTGSGTAMGNWCSAADARITPGGGVLRLGMGEYEHEWVLCPSSGCRIDAVVSGHQALPSTDGPVEHGTVSCAAGHQILHAERPAGAARQPARRQPSAPTAPRFATDRTRGLTGGSSGRTSGVTTRRPSIPWSLLTPHRRPEMIMEDRPHLRPGQECGGRRPASGRTRGPRHRAP